MAISSKTLPNPPAPDSSDITVNVVPNMDANGHYGVYKVYKNYQDQDHKGTEISFTGSTINGVLNTGIKVPVSSSEGVRFTATPTLPNPSPAYSRNYYIEGKMIKWKVTTATSGGPADIEKSGLDINDGIQDEIGTATLTAYPKVPCQFVNWTKSGSGSAKLNDSTQTTVSTQAVTLSDVKTNDITMTATVTCKTAVTDPNESVVQGTTTRTWQEVFNMAVNDDNACVLVKYPISNSDITSGENVCTSKTYFKTYSAHYEEYGTNIKRYNYVYHARGGKTSAVAPQYGTNTTSSGIPAINECLYFNNLYDYHGYNPSLYNYNTNVLGAAQVCTLSYGGTNYTPGNVTSAIATQNFFGGIGGGTSTIIPRNSGGRWAYSNSCTTGGGFYPNSTWIAISMIQPISVDINTSAQVYRSNWLKLAGTSTIVNPSSYPYYTVFKVASNNGGFTGHYYTWSGNYYDRRHGVYDMLPDECFNVTDLNLTGITTINQLMDKTINSANEDYYAFELEIKEDTNFQSTLSGSDDFPIYYTNEVTISSGNITKLNNNYVSKSDPHYITVYNATNGTKKSYIKVEEERTFVKKTTGGTAASTDPYTPTSNGTTYDFVNGVCGEFNGWYTIDSDGNRVLETTNSQITLRSPDACCEVYKPITTSCSDDYVLYGYYSEYTSENIDYKKLYKYYLVPLISSGTTYATSIPTGAVSYDLNIANIIGYGIGYSDGSDIHVNGKRNLSYQVVTGGTNRPIYFALRTGEVMYSNGITFLSPVSSGHYKIASATEDGVAWDLNKSSSTSTSYKLDEVEYIRNTSNNTHYYMLKCTEDDVNVVLGDNACFVGNYDDTEEAMKSGEMFLVGDGNFIDDIRFGDNLVYKNTCGVEKSVHIIGCNDNSTALGSVMGLDGYYDYGFTVSSRPDDLDDGIIDRYHKEYTNVNILRYEDAGTSYSSYLYTTVTNADGIRNCLETKETFKVNNSNGIVFNGETYENGHYYKFGSSYKEGSHMLAWDDLGEAFVNHFTMTGSYLAGGCYTEAREDRPYHYLMNCYDSTNVFKFKFVTDKPLTQYLRNIWVVDPETGAFTTQGNPNPYYGNDNMAARKAIMRPGQFILDNRKQRMVLLTADNIDNYYADPSEYNIYMNPNSPEWNTHDVISLTIFNSLIAFPFIDSYNEIDFSKNALTYSENTYVDLHICHRDVRYQNMLMAVIETVDNEDVLKVYKLNDYNNRTSLSAWEEYTDMCLVMDYEDNGSYYSPVYNNDRDHYVYGKDENQTETFGRWWPTDKIDEMIDDGIISDYPSEYSFSVYAPFDSYLRKYLVIDDYVSQNDDGKYYGEEKYYKHFGTSYSGSYTTVTNANGIQTCFYNGNTFKVNKSGGITYDGITFQHNHYYRYSYIRTEQTRNKKAELTDSNYELNPIVFDGYNCFPYFLDLRDMPGHGSVYVVKKITDVSEVNYDYYPFKMFVYDSSNYNIRAYNGKYDLSYDDVLNNGGTLLQLIQNISAYNTEYGTPIDENKGYFIYSKLSNKTPEYKLINTVGSTIDLFNAFNDELRYFVINSGFEYNGFSYSVNNAYFLNWIDTPENSSSEFYTQSGLWWDSQNGYYNIVDSQSTIEHMLENNKIYVPFNGSNTTTISEFFCTHDGFDKNGYYVGVPYVNEDDGFKENIGVFSNYYSSVFSTDNGMYVGYVDSDVAYETRFITIGVDGNFYVKKTGVMIDGEFFENSSSEPRWLKLKDGGAYRTMLNYLMDGVGMSKNNHVSDGYSYFNLTAPVEMNGNTPLDDLDGYEYVLSTLPSGQSATNVSSYQDVINLFVYTYTDNGTSYTSNYTTVANNAQLQTCITQTKPNAFYVNSSSNLSYGGVTYTRYHYYVRTCTAPKYIRATTDIALVLPSSVVSSNGLSRLIPAQSILELKTNYYKNVQLTVGGVTSNYTLRFMGWVIESEPRYEFYCNSDGDYYGVEEYPLPNSFVEVPDEVGALYDSVQIDYTNSEFEECCNAPLNYTEVYTEFDLERCINNRKTFKVTNPNDVSDSSKSYNYNSYYYSLFNDLATAVNNRYPVIYINTDDVIYDNKMYTSGKYYYNTAVDSVIYSADDVERVLSNKPDYILIADYFDDEYRSGVTYTTVKSIDDLIVAINNNTEYIYIDSCSSDNFAYNYKTYVHDSYYKRATVTVRNSVRHGGDVLKRQDDTEFISRDYNLKALPCQLCTAVYTYNFHVNICPMTTPYGCVGYYDDVTNSPLNGAIGVYYDGYPTVATNGWGTDSIAIDYKHFVHNHTLSYYETLNSSCGGVNAYYIGGCIKDRDDKPVRVDPDAINDITTFINGILPCNEYLGPAHSCGLKIITNNPSELFGNSVLGNSNMTNYPYYDYMVVYKTDPDTYQDAGTSYTGQYTTVTNASGIQTCMNSNTTFKVNHSGGITYNGITYQHNHYYVCNQDTWYHWDSNDNCYAKMAAAPSQVNPYDVLVIGHEWNYDGNDSDYIPYALNERKTVGVYKINFVAIDSNEEIDNRDLITITDSNDNIYKYTGIRGCSQYVTQNFDHALASFSHYIKIEGDADYLNNELKWIGYDLHFSGSSIYKVLYTKIYDTNNITTDVDNINTIYLRLPDKSHEIPMSTHYNRLWCVTSSAVYDNCRFVDTQTELETAIQNNIPIFFINNGASDGIGGFEVNGVFYSEGYYYSNDTTYDTSGRISDGMAFYGGCKYRQNYIKAMFTTAQPQLNAPTMLYDNAGHVTMNTNNSGVQGVQIRYTDNGNTPTPSSTLYSGVITFSGTKTFKAICVANGYTPSNVTINTYSYTPPTPQQLTEPVVTEVYNG